MRINYIETGNVNMSAADLKNATKGHPTMPNRYFSEYRARMNVLTHDQMRMIIRMEELADIALKRVAY
jgi:hypothetical protein